MSWIRAEAEIAAADGCEIALVAYTLNFGEITSSSVRGGASAVRWSRAENARFSGQFGVILQTFNGTVV